MLLTYSWAIQWMRTSTSGDAITVAWELTGTDAEGFRGQFQGQTIFPVEVGFELDSALAMLWLERRILIGDYKTMVDDVLAAQIAAQRE